MTNDVFEMPERYRANPDQMNDAYEFFQFHDQVMSEMSPEEISLFNELEFILHDLREN